MEKKRKTTQGIKTLPTSIKEKRIPRAEAPCNLFTKRNKRKKSMGVRRVTSSSPCLIMLMRVERSLFESSFGASKHKLVWQTRSREEFSQLSEAHHRGQGRGAVTNPPEPHWPLSFFSWWRGYMVPRPRVSSFPSLMSHQ
eukprot:1139084-Pelagomonas_calceolata.AAC.2